MPSRQVQLISYNENNNKDVNKGLNGTVNVGYVDCNGDVTAEPITEKDNQVSMTPGEDGGEEPWVEIEMAEIDPWDLPEVIGGKPPKPWSELTELGKVKRVVWDYIGRPCFVFGFLYMFICSMSFLSAAFQLLGGKAVGATFANQELLSNPVAGLMIGVLATVLVQSSSTSTSVVVAMVATEIISVRHAVFIIMGANIGTSVTNTIVALSQVSDRTQFRRAFAGATVHDMFNWLTVIILLPIEAGCHYLHILSEIIIPLGNETNIESREKVEILNVITKPFTKYIISLDTKKKLAASLDNEGEFHGTIIKWCKKFAEQPEMNDTGCGGNMTCQEEGEKICLEKYPFIFMEVANVWSDEAIGAILLFVSLGLMLFCLIMIVKLLNSMLRGKVAQLVRKFMNANLPGKLSCLTGYIAIFVGAALTIIVQSSSIFTSSMTPLVGMGVISINRMYPLTLGSNIGTTFTAILASLVNSGLMLKLGLQIALCHLFFNITGILIWYPIPFMRKVPIELAKGLGNITANYRWFAPIYLFAVFFLFPAAIFGLSMAGWEVLAGVMVPIVVLLLAIIVINVLQNKKPMWLPAKLQNWEFLPIWFRSLAPYDKLLMKLTSICKCKSKKSKAKPELNKSNMVP